MKVMPMLDKHDLEKTKSGVSCSTVAILGGVEQVLAPQVEMPKRRCNSHPLQMYATA